MSTPHDYYTYNPDHPELHNRGEGRFYLEPDWHASRHDMQLPALSAIGRGPRGEGLYVGTVVNQDGEVSFTLNSTITGETVWESPNLAPWEIEFTPTMWADIAAGIPAALDIKQTRGNQTHTTHAYLPPGQEGSRIFVLGGIHDIADDNTYTTTVADLTIYGRVIYQNRPVPRPNDIVMFAAQDTIGNKFIGVGSVDNVGGTTRENYGGGDIPTPTNVVFTCNMYVPTYTVTSYNYTNDISEIITQTTAEENAIRISLVEYVEINKLAQLHIRFVPKTSHSGMWQPKLGTLVEGKRPLLDHIQGIGEDTNDHIRQVSANGANASSNQGAITLSAYNISTLSYHLTFTYFIP